MFQSGTVAYLWAETPVHAGSGSSVGAVDLPIQRERATNLPMIAGSGLKGCLRELAELKAAQGSLDARTVEALFGPPPPSEGGGGNDYAGALSVGDARLLALPVRSLSGVFAWVTSAYCLERWARDVSRAGGTPPALPAAAGANQARVGTTSQVLANDKLVLEEFSADGVKDAAVDRFAKHLAQCYLGAPGDAPGYWHQVLPARLAIVHDDALAELSLLAMEVVTRVRLENETKTVARGALWTEEQLPAETLLYAPILATAERRPRAQDQSALNADALLDKLRKVLAGGVLQIGGNETVGRGFCRVRL